MSDETEAFAAPGKLTLGDKTYTFSPLTLKQMAEVKAIFKGRQKSEAIAWIRELPPDMRPDAIKEATRLALSTEAFDAWLASPESRGEMLLKTLEANHPEIKTPEDALKVLEGIPSEMLDTVFGEVTGLDAAKN